MAAGPTAQPTDWQTVTPSPANGSDPGDWQTVSGGQQPGVADKAKAFWSGLTETSPFAHPINTVESMGTAARHPIDTAESMLQGARDTAARAQAAGRKGDYTQAIIHGALALVPGIGPQLSQHYGEMRDAQDRGDEVGEANAAGKLIGLATNAAVPDAVATGGRVAGAVARSLPDAAVGAANAVGRAGAAARIAAPGITTGAATILGSMLAQHLGLPEAWIGELQGGRDILRGINKGISRSSYEVQNRAALRDIPKGEPPPAPTPTPTPTPAPESEPAPSAPAPQSATAAAPDLDMMLSNLREQWGLPRDPSARGAGEAKTGPRVQERWDEGSGAPTIKSTTPQKTASRTVSVDSPLAQNPRALAAAQALADELDKNGPFKVGDHVQVNGKDAIIKKINPDGTFDY